MLTIHIAVRAALTTVLRMGYQTWSRNMETLTRRINIDKTDTATLKSVRLPTSQFFGRSGSRDKRERTFETTRVGFWVMAHNLRMRIIFALDPS